LKTPLFVALDVDTDKQALEIADAVGEWVGGFKVGPRLGLRYGGVFLKEIARRGALFVDNKYLDIPSTMIAAVKASFEAGASYVTIHASAGAVALKQLAGLEAELRREREFHLLAVTVLTSFSEKTLPANWDKNKSLADHVKALAEESQSQGVSGLVCSPAEVKELRRLHPKAYLLTPGIRPAFATGKDDQSRIATPAEALRDGASALVVGRPILEASSPKEAAQAIYKEIQGFLS
jgi:orotidine-5'-phosphate decarboxylase